MSISVQPLPGTIADPLYPDSDGEPVGETEYHFVALWHVYSALAHWYRRSEDVHVAGNMLLYYEKGNPSAVRGPDIMVSKGVRGKHPRRSFRIWEEGAVPTVILEITSAKTRVEDQGPKPLVYADIGVKEYFMFDTQGEYLHPRLQGFQLIKGKYVSLPTDESGRIFSRELGLVLAADNFLLRLVDPATGKALPTEDEYIEQIAKAKRAARNAKREAVEAKRRETDAKRAAEFAQVEAETQRRRAAELEAELAKLRAKLHSENSE